MEPFEMKDGQKRNRLCQDLADLYTKTYPSVPKLEPCVIHGTMFMKVTVPGWVYSEEGSIEKPFEIFGRLPGNALSRSLEFINSGQAHAAK
jgi:hypothetical protein